MVEFDYRAKSVLDTIPPRAVWVLLVSIHLFVLAAVPQPRRLRIELNGDLRIELEANGCGFDADRPGKAGRGLTNIRSRASLIEAYVNWTTRPEGGTRFTLRASARRATEEIL